MLTQHPKMTVKSVFLRRSKGESLPRIAKHQWFRMARMVMVLFFAIVALVPASPIVVNAQGTPPPSFSDALTNLGKRYGRTIALTDFDNKTSSWKWEGATFKAGNLDCAAITTPVVANVTSAGVIGYIFTFVLRGVKWEYRVAANDRNSLVLCSSSNKAAKLGGVTISTTKDGCPANLPARLVLNKNGRVLPGSANRLRQTPTLVGAEVGKIPGGGQFVVQEGPSCDSGVRWFKVKYNDLVGWTAEGADGVYFTEPLS